MCGCVARRQRFALLPFTMNPLLKRVGIVELNEPGWTGGLQFMRLLAQVLDDACRGAGVELLVLTDQMPNTEERHNLLDDPDRIVTVTPRNHIRGKKFLRGLLQLPDGSDLLETARKNKVDVLLPLLSVPDGVAELKTVGWIPDFQHLHLPGYFSEADRQARDERFRLLAERASLVMLTSRDAGEDFAAFAPEQVHKARVVSFPSSVAPETIIDDPHNTVRKFNLPKKFALVTNQFWRHKNHEAVVEAIAQLRRKNVRIPVVMTGLPADYRDPSNRVLSQTLQAIACAGLGDQVILLGFVPNDEVVALMRAAALVIQPSRFEGWSTVVQNAKALGRPIVCSDIAAHREQAPHALGFFPCERAEALADILAACWPQLEPGLGSRSGTQGPCRGAQGGETVRAIDSETMSRSIQPVIPQDGVDFHPHSFGDPAGRLFRWNGEIYRGIRGGEGSRFIHGCSRTA